MSVFSALGALLLLLVPALLVGMARVDFPTMDDESYPNFLKDWSNRQSIMPGGIMLDPAKWTTDPQGDKYVRAGILVGRTSAEQANGDPFGPVSDNALSIDASTPADDEVTINGEDLRDSLSKPYNRKLEITGVSAAADGVYTVDTVAVAGGNTTVAFQEDLPEDASGGTLHIVTDDEAYLTYRAVTDLVDDPVVEAVRPGALIAIKQLPDYSSLSEPVKAYVRATYTVQDA